MEQWEKIKAYVTGAGIKHDDPTPTFQSYGGTHASGSFHYLRQALDFGALESDPVAVSTLVKPLVDSAGNLIVELICDVNGADVCFRRWASPQWGWPNDGGGLRSAHGNHCHIAVNATGDFPGLPAKTPYPSIAEVHQTMYVFSDPQQPGSVLALQADGGIINEHGGRFFGSGGGHPHNAPAVGVAWTASGNGYWIVYADGGLENYGDAVYHGNLVDHPQWDAGAGSANGAAVGIVAHPAGGDGGYTIVTFDGQTYHPYNLPA